MAIKAKSPGLGSVLLLMAAAAVVWWMQHDLGQLTGGGGYVWVDHRHNDGDSFHVRTPEGEEQEIRLYFVDAPESALKSYADGNTNHERVDDQARDLGLSREEAVAIGREAKAWVRETLRGKEFTVFTQGEKVFNGPRIYGFVQVESGEERRWLHELLVERGLVRIHTKGAKLPDGTSRRAQERHLKELERAARERSVGAWKR